VGPDGFKECESNSLVRGDANQNSAESVNMPKPKGGVKDVSGIQGVKKRRSRLRLQHPPRKEKKKESKKKMMELSLERLKEKCELL